MSVTLMKRNADCVEVPMSDDSQSKIGFLARCRMFGGYADTTDEATAAVARHEPTCETCQRRALLPQ